MVRLLLVHGASFLHISNKGVYYSMWAEGMIQNGECLDCVAVNCFFLLEYYGQSISMQCVANCLKKKKTTIL